jgi:hypothetical protein
MRRSAVELATGHRRLRCGHVARVESAKRILALAQVDDADEDASDIQHATYTVYALRRKKCLALA